MDVASYTSFTPSAVNSAEGNKEIAALKIAAQSERAIVAVVEETAESLKAIAPPGQGQNVDIQA